MPEAIETNYIYCWVLPDPLHAKRYLRIDEIQEYRYRTIWHLAQGRLPILSISSAMTWGQYLLHQAVLQE